MMIWKRLLNKILSEKSHLWTGSSPKPPSSMTARIWARLTRRPFGGICCIYFGRALESVRCDTTDLLGQRIFSTLTSGAWYWNMPRAWWPVWWVSRGAGKVGLFLSSTTVDCSSILLDAIFRTYTTLRCLMFFGTARASKNASLACSQSILFTCTAYDPSSPHTIVENTPRGTILIHQPFEETIAGCGCDICCETIELRRYLRLGCCCAKRIWFPSNNRMRY